jgi:hypothetical protein|eukprot:COSAG01_NODE_259_length_20069_cov_21.507762_25_plen_44_part_00
MDQLLAAQAQQRIKLQQQLQSVKTWSDVSAGTFGSPPPSLGLF